MDAENSVQEQDKKNYEDTRRQKMLENQNLLKELGLLSEDGLSTTNIVLSELSPDTVTNTSKKRNKYKPKIMEKPNRLSKRLRGEAPEESADLEEILDHRDRIIQMTSRSKLEKLNEQKKELEETKSTIPDIISTPFTLLSIETTVWDMGKIYTGKDRSKYWSNHACRYKHPYPVGYRASKDHFGNSYTMTISEGPEGEGPMFSVQVNNSNLMFKGSTPTAPWTTACLKSKSQGTRVSGPLFYGFSDLITMKLIEELENYDKSMDPKETIESINDNTITQSRSKN